MGRVNGFVAVADFRDHSEALVSEVFFNPRRNLPLRKQDESLTDRARLIQPATVVANDRICREHYRLQMSLAEFPPSRPGQYLHLSPQAPAPSPYRTWDHGEYGASSKRRRAAGGTFTAGGELRSMQWPACDDRIPMLRRAFSIAGLERQGGGVPPAASALVDVVYRVVGRASRWMQSLHIGDKVSVLGPLGKSFPICKQKPVAWLVAGGVGLPPMFWLAEALHAAGKRVVAFCGAQTAELLALTLDPSSVHSDRPTVTPGALKCTLSRFRAAEFAQNRVPVVVSTDDGSLGFHGHVGHAWRKPCMPPARAWSHSAGRKRRNCWR